MGYLNTLLKKLQDFNPEEFAEDLLEEGDIEEDAVELLRQQLYDGENPEGGNLSPTIFDDPYFKTYEAALAYSTDKDERTPNPNRPPGVPNLFLTGEYHRSIESTIVNGELVFFATSRLANKLDAKYDDPLRLNHDSRKEMKEQIEPAFKKKLASVIGLKFK